MQRIPLLILAFIIMIVTEKVPAFPQESASASLNRRYERCLSKAPCTEREDLRFLEELTEAMRNDLRRIEQVCVKTGYKDCFNPAASDVADWHKMHSHMSDIANVLERRYTSAKTGEQLNLLEPSAGPESPNPYTNPDQQQLNENKRDWWRGEGWAPPDEDNPYHKW